RPSSGNASVTRRASGATMRFAMPRWASASISTTGRLRSQAARAAGPAAYPPAPTTTSAWRRRIARAARGPAAAARPSAARVRSGMRRSRPRIGTRSSGNPAAATSPAAAPRPLAMNPTSAPRARSALATASAGITCPAVPPAAISTRVPEGAGPGGAPAAADVDEDPNGAQEYHEVGPACRDERQRHAGDRHHAEHRAEVHGGLDDDQRRDAGGERALVDAPRAQRDPVARDPERRIAGHERQEAHQAELLADVGGDHVRRRLGQVVVLLDSVAETAADRPA